MLPNIFSIVDANSMLCECVYDKINATYYSELRTVTMVAFLLL